MAFPFLPSDVGVSIPGISFSTPLRFNGYQFGGTTSGSTWANSSIDIRIPPQEITRADIDWRYEHEARVTRERMRGNSIESTPGTPFINSNMLYSTHRFGYEQRNPFFGCPANGSAVNSVPRQRQETGSFTRYENEVFSHYASSHNRELGGIRGSWNSNPNVWSRANVGGNNPIMKLQGADVERKLTAVRASLPESEIPKNIPSQHCLEGSHEGKKPCYGSVTPGGEQISNRPQATFTMKLPFANHSVSEILIEANIHNQKEVKEGNEENPTDVSGEKVVCDSVNSESLQLHQIGYIQNAPPGKPVCSNGATLAENPKKGKKWRRLRNSKNKKTHPSIETQSTIPGNKAVEELSCRYSIDESKSLCSVEAHVKGMKHNAKGGSSIATKGIKRVKHATKQFKDGMKKVKNFKKVSKKRNLGRNFWCKMCNVEGTDETSLLIHRNGRKHLKMLRKNRGAVLVVSCNQIGKGMIS